MKLVLFWWILVCVTRCVGGASVGANFSFHKEKARPTPAAGPVVSLLCSVPPGVGSWRVMAFSVSFNSVVFCVVSFQGSVYQRARPQQEISAQSRDEFWSQQEVGMGPASVHLCSNMPVSFLVNLELSVPPQFPCNKSVCCMLTANGQTLFVFSGGGEGKREREVGCFSYGDFCWYVVFVCFCFH